MTSMSWGAWGASGDEPRLHLRGDLDGRGSEEHAKDAQPPQQNRGELLGVRSDHPGRRRDDGLVPAARARGRPLELLAPRILSGLIVRPHGDPTLPPELAIGFFFEFRSVSSWCQKIRERDEVVQWEGEDTSRARREKRIVLGAFKKKERENSTPLDDLRRSSLQRGHAGGVQPQISESLVQDFITTFASLFLPAAPPLYLMRSLQHSFSRNCL